MALVAASRSISPSPSSHNWRAICAQFVQGGQGDAFQCAQGIEQCAGWRGPTGQQFALDDHAQARADLVERVAHWREIGQVTQAQRHAADPAAGEGPQGQGMRRCDAPLAGQRQVFVGRKSQLMVGHDPHLPMELRLGPDGRGRHVAAHGQHGPMAAWRQAGLRPLFGQLAEGTEQAWIGGLVTVVQANERRRWLVAGKARDMQGCAKLLRGGLPSIKHLQRLALEPAPIASMLPLLPQSPGPCSQTTRAPWAKSGPDRRGRGKVPGVDTGIWAGKPDSSGDSGGWMDIAR